MLGLDVQSKWYGRFQYKLSFLDSDKEKQKDGLMYYLPHPDPSTQPI